MMMKNDDDGYFRRARKIPLGGKHTTRRDSNNFTFLLQTDLKENLRMTGFCFDAA